MSEFVMNDKPISLADFDYDMEPATIQDILIEHLTEMENQLISVLTMIAINTRTKYIGDNSSLEKVKAELTQAISMSIDKANNIMRGIDGLKWAYSQLVTDEQYESDIGGNPPKQPVIHIQPQSQLITPASTGKVVGVPGVIDENNSSAGLVSS